MEPYSEVIGYEYSKDTKVRSTVTLADFNNEMKELLKVFSTWEEANRSTKMKILSVQVIDPLIEDGETTQVRVLNARNKTALVRVPTTNGVYRQDLGCAVYASKGCLIGERVNKDFFDAYDEDMEKVIKAVEAFLNMGEEKRTIDPFQQKEH